MTPVKNNVKVEVNCLDCPWRGNDRQDGSNHARTSRHNVEVLHIEVEVYPGQDLCASCKSMGFIRTGRGGAVPCDDCNGKGHTHQP